MGKAHHANAHGAAPCAKPDKGARGPGQSPETNSSANFFKDNLDPFGVALVQRNPALADCAEA